MLIVKRFSFLVLICFAAGNFAGAQDRVVQKGITGVVLDAETKEPVIGAAIIIEGTTIGTATNVMGEFNLTKLKDGIYNIECQSLAYETLIKKDVLVDNSRETRLEIKLKPLTININEVLITARANREKENILLIEQQKAMVSMEAIGAHQLSVQGISNAAAAATRIAGVVKQGENQTINVRGLGDRYNATTLNGLPLPSNHAENKNIDLALFPSDIISTVGVAKNFTSGNSGDVTGANVDIVSKKHSGSPYVQLGVGTEYNNNLAGSGRFVLQSGPNYFGTNSFQIPSSIGYYSFNNSWNPQERNATPSTNFGISGGKTFAIGENQLNTFVTYSFSNGYNYNNYIERRVNGSNDNRMDLRGNQFSYETQSTAMLNLNYSTKKTDIYLNSFALNASNQEMKQMSGYIIDVVGDPNSETAVLRRSDYERNTVYVNQLIGEHRLDDGYSLNWRTGYNHINNTLPDRRKNIFVYSNGSYTPSDNDAANNHRYFHFLKENEVAGNIELNKTFGSGLNTDKSFRGKLSIGGFGRYKIRSFEAFQYNHELDKTRVQTIDIENVDAYFNDDRMQQGYFNVKTFFSTLNRPSTYGGNQLALAGYASVEYDITDKLSGLMGVRVEYIAQMVNYETSLRNGNNGFNELKPLPSLSLRYAVNSMNNLRLSSSMSYTLPQFKETAPFLFEGITDATVGNPYLYPSTNYNGEMKWEYFPKSYEVVSVALMGKYIQNPINKFVMASASNDFTYANTGDWAYVYGVEAEIRKNILNKTTDKVGQKLDLGMNVSMMKTYQELNSAKIKRESRSTVLASFDKEHDALEGAAPLIINANITYATSWKKGLNTLSASLVYNYTSERLNLIGYSSIGNQYNMPINDLGVVVKTKINKVSFSVNVKNILNPKYERIQRNSTQSHIISSYTEGIQFGVSASYML